MRNHLHRPQFVFLLAFSVFTVQAGKISAPCKIEIREKGSGLPVPLVELETTHHMRFVSDNAGIIAIAEPELMDRNIWFSIHGNGYTVPKDAYQYSGICLKPVPGGELHIEVERTIRAKRLGRLTGAGLFAESQKLGDRQNEPEGGEFGCDSVQSAIYKGKTYWIWGDTTLSWYPLGIFDATGATAPILPFPKAKPPIRPPFSRFRDASGQVRACAKMPGNGPTWISGLVTLKDSGGHERLCASYVKIKPPLEPVFCGQCVWEDNKNTFLPLGKIWEKIRSKPTPPAFTDGHPAFWTDEKGKRWVLFGNPFPRLQCPATFEGWKDRNAWRELMPQTEVPTANGEKAVKPQSGSIAWSGFRKRWVAVFTENLGKPSALGEVWYAEAASPLGPWANAVKILSHENYTFYNPFIHMEGATGNEPYLLFEGTYTAMFADHPAPTPRYDYTQILYRLDFSDLPK